MSDDLASRWYSPFELEVLQKAALLVVLCSIPVLWVASLRENGELLVLLGMISGLLSFKALGGENRDLMMLSSALIMLLGSLFLYQATLRGVAMIDIWYSVILICSGGYGLWSLSSSHVSKWLNGRLGVEAAERGLARNRILRPRWAGIFTHALLLHFVFIVMVPILWIIDVSLSPGQTASGSLDLSAWTLTHFSSVLEKDDFWTWVSNSIIISIGTTLLGLLLAIPAGYAFSRHRFSGHGVMMFSLLLVQMFPGVIILVPYFMVMKSLGLLNSWLGLILAYSVTALPFCVWMLKGWFDTVPLDLEEAAALDGCGQFGIFWRIIIPLSLPAIAVTALFSFLAAWNEFLLALMFNQSPDMYTLPVGLAFSITQAQKWGDFAAMSLLVSIPVVILFIVFQKSLIQGLSSGGVKG